MNRTTMFSAKAALAQTMLSLAVLAAPVMMVSVASVPSMSYAQTKAGTISNAEAGRMVESYFSGLTTMKANFTQQISGQAFTQEGMFTLKKPNQFLWQYETPDPQKIIATGTATYFVNDERSQVTQMPNNSGLARFFNAKQFSLAKAGASVSSATATATQLTVKLKVNDKVRVNDQAGLRSVTLVFDKAGNALTIKQIVALDTLNATTTVSFSNVQTGIAVPDSLFKFTPPKQG